MILDSSAVVALLSHETGADTLVDAIALARSVAIGAPTLAETGIVLSVKWKRDAHGALRRFLQEADAEVIPFIDEHASEAVRAFHRFGKGRHAAALNFGDCMTYAVAKLARRPLLFVGNDFAKTDLDRA